MPDASPQRLFVYGTLRTDLGYTKLKGGESLGSGTIQGDMFSADDAFPAVVPGEGQVTGELVSFDSLTSPRWASELYRLDHYEGVGMGLYRREVVPVTLDDGTVVEAWTYIFNDEDATDAMPPVPSGDWADVVEGRL